MLPRQAALLGLRVALFGLAADQVSKFFLIQLLGRNGDQPIAVLPVFDLVMWWNKGVSFSMFHTGSAWGPYVFSIASLVIVALLVVWQWRTTNPLMAIAVGAVAGGAIGNVVDRLRLGAVADFFYAHIGEYGWPAFNVADTLIVVGTFILMFDWLFTGRKDTALAQRKES